MLHLNKKELRATTFFPAQPETLLRNQQVIMFLAYALHLIAKKVMTIARHWIGLGQS